MEQILNKYLNRDVISIIKKYSSCLCGSNKECVRCAYRESIRWMYVCRICSEPWRWTRPCYCRSSKSKPVKIKFKEQHRCKIFICNDCAKLWYSGEIVCINAIRDFSIYCKSCYAYCNTYRKCKICKKLYCPLCINSKAKCLNCI